MRSAIVILSLMVLALAAVPASAAILVVDCANGPFLDIGSAVLAAGSGDTVLVHVCTVFPFSYPPFSVIGKDRVHVVAADVTASAAMGGRRVGFGTVPLTLFDPPVVVDGSLGFGECALIQSSFGVSITGLKLIKCIRGPGVRVQFSEETTVVANRIENADREGIVSSESFATRIIGNLVFNNGLEFNTMGIISIQSSRTLIADNQVGANNGHGIFVIDSPPFVSAVHIVNNQVVGNSVGGILDSSTEARIERNTVLRNGLLQISLGPDSTNADVVGNITGFNIIDQGVGTELQDNQ